MMHVCFSYLWRVWRMKLTLFGLCFLSILLLAGVHFIKSEQENSPSSSSTMERAFRSTQKRLQQTETLGKSERSQRVRFLPRKKADKHIYTNAHHVEETVLKKRIYINGPFKEDLNMAQPIALGNTEYGGGVEDMSDHLSPPKVYPALYRGDQPVQEEGGKEPVVYVPQRRIVHLDLKGAPPKVSFVLRMLKWIKELGGTGILLEYEDMFPFKGQLAKVAALNHYHESDIRAILSSCKKLNLEVIPLIQTFGHMEFILKHDQFSQLRDAAEMPESICPCHNETMSLLFEYIDQVILAHSFSQFVHIGCDEVYHLGGCLSCQGISRTELYVSHVARVATYIKERHKKKSIIWDDMLRGFLAAEIKPLADLVEPMIWVYAEDPYRFMPSYNWDRLSEVFSTAWTASAFKGADGPTSVVPDVSKRLQNNLNWLLLMGTEESKFKEDFRGIVLTGWQRYDHFAVLCELLPAAIPSLAINLVATEHGYFNESLKHELYKKLDCAENVNVDNSFFDFENDPFLWDRLAWCFFPGAQFFKVTKTYQIISRDVKEFIRKVYSEQGWMTDYNYRRNYSSPMRLDEGMSDFSKLQFSVNNVIRHAHASLTEIYDEYTVAEWIEQKLYPLFKDLVTLKNQTDSLKLHRHWGSRPLPILPVLKEFGIGYSSTASPLIESSSSLAAKHVKQLPAAHDRGFASIEMVTIRPKRLVQAPDYYRHPPGSFQFEKRKS